MRFLIALPVLVGIVVADFHVDIPEIVQAIEYVLSEFEPWPHYTGPTGTLKSATAAPTATGTATCSSYWLENIKHQGISAFNPVPATYQVFRNVKDFGAKGCVGRDTYS